MKQRLLLLILCCWSGLRLQAELAPNKLAELDTQLELLLPGTSNQEQSARAFAKERISVLISDLEGRKIRRKSINKALDLLEEEVALQFLQRPAYFADFDQLFKLGQYDRTTATALYALAMEYFGLPYLLQVRDAEILLIADPQEAARPLALPHEDPWTAESSQRFQNAYLEVLRSIGYVSPAEWDRSPKALYDQYYMGGATSLNLRQMASFLYYRQALKAYANEAWSSSLDWLYRAEKLASWPVHEVIRRAVWLQLANQPDNTSESLRYLWMIWKDSPGAPWQKELLQRFSSAISEEERKLSSWQIDSTYFAYKEQFANHPGAVGQLRELYYLQRARYHARESNTEAVMSFMDSLYSLRPYQSEVQDVLAGMLVWSLRAERDYTKGLERISEYERQYPFLGKNPLFQDRHLFYQAERIRYHFNADEDILGGQYLEEFKKHSRRINKPPSYISWVTTAYLAASDYHFRNGDYRQALMLVEEARQEAPQDSYLDHRSDVLRRYLR